MPRQGHTKGSNLDFESAPLALLWTWVSSSKNTWCLSTMPFRTANKSDQRARTYRRWSRWPVTMRSTKFCPESSRKLWSLMTSLTVKRSAGRHGRLVTKSCDDSPFARRLDMISSPPSTPTMNQQNRTASMNVLAFVAGAPVALRYVMYCHAWLSLKGIQRWPTFTSHQSLNDFKLRKRFFKVSGLFSPKQASNSSRPYAS